MTSRRISAALSIASAIGLALAGGAAEAGTQKEVTVVAPAPPDVLSERVSYADLDLASQAGVASLNFRVSGAVKRVCAPHDERHSFGDYGACRSFASDGAEPQVALAIARARQLAATGTTAIAPVAIVIAAPAR
jgi:UrcA family protein